MSNFNFSGNINNSNMIPIYIDNDVIYNFRTNEIVGYTADSFQQAIDKAKEYKEMLYEHNILVRPKTNEDIIKEQSELIKNQAETLKQANENMQKLTDTINNLMAQQKQPPKEISNVQHQSVVGQSNSQSDRDKPKQVITSSVASKV